MICRRRSTLNASHVYAAVTVAFTSALCRFSRVTPPSAASVPSSPPANVSPAPVGSITSTSGHAGTISMSSCDIKNAPCSPFLISAYFGPMSKIFFAAFSSEPLPVRCRASCSFTVSRSTRAITFIRSSRVVLIHRSIVSSTVNFGFSIWSSTRACSAGAMFSRHRYGLVR